ncbi:hypothetical protein MHK_001879 [Candidatus Magnetomorum sp. HK-1]|nr:hypothetical protein MHK_001879 [Candidatus Magnetomorum sp. HK-1]
MKTVDEGANEGDLLTFRVWDLSNLCEIAITEDMFLPISINENFILKSPYNPPKWTKANGIWGLNINTCSDEIIPLVKGLNIFSFTVNKVFYDSNSPPGVNTLSNADFVKVGRLDDVLSSIEGSYSIIRNFDVNGGLDYDPLVPTFFNTLHYLASGYAYRINMSKPANLILKGIRAQKTDTLQLSEGWNLVGCWHSDLQYIKQPLSLFKFPPNAKQVKVTSIKNIFQQIDGYYSIIRYPYGRDDSSSEALILDPELADSENSLNFIAPGHGFWIKLKSSQTLHYDVNLALQLKDYNSKINNTYYYTSNDKNFTFTGQKWYNSLITINKTPIIQEGSRYFSQNHWQYKPRLMQGEQRLVFSGYDLTGYECASITAFVMYDTIPPEVTYTKSPSEHIIYTSTTVTINIKSSDATHYKYKLDDNEESDEITVSQDLILKDLFTSNTDTFHKLELITRDEAGNWQTHPQYFSWMNITGEKAYNIPVAYTRTIITAPQMPLYFKLQATDEDLDPLTFKILKDCQSGTLKINPLTGESVYTPVNSGTDSFIFSAHDGYFESNPATISIINKVSLDEMLAELEIYSQNDALITFNNPDQYELAYYHENVPIISPTIGPILSVNLMGDMHKIMLICDAAAVGETLFLKIDNTVISSFHIPFL